jgi:hypothetical protein
MRRLVLVVLIGLSLVVVSTVLAQSGSGYDLTWNTVDGGGDTSTGSGYTLVGTIGQSDAELPMNGGGYSLAGGFWISEASQYRVHLPLVIK